MFTVAQLLASRRNAPGGGSPVAANVSVVNDDWLLWDLKKDKKGAQVNFAPGENK
jgi:hypothetical protein